MTSSKSGKKITKSDISVPVTMMKPMNDGSVSFQKGKGSDIPFMDLQLEGEAIEEPAMTMQQYQDFLQAVAAFRKSIQATAMTAEKFVRALEDVTNYASKSKYSINLITQLFANANMIWAEALEREFEGPIATDIKAHQARGKLTQHTNQKKINELIASFHKEEHDSYKKGKKQQRDLGMLTNSLNSRVSYVTEIKRLLIDNSSIYDRLASESVEFILEHCAIGIRRELETFETIVEGLKKLGAFQTAQEEEESYIDEKAPSDLIFTEEEEKFKLDFLREALKDI
eukprot:jgi/Orpsp1_1/1191725/evm.model.d7180000088076.1